MTENIEILNLIFKYMKKDKIPDVEFIKRVVDTVRLNTDEKMVVNYILVCNESWDKEQLTELGNMNYEKRKMTINVL